MKKKVIRLFILLVFALVFGIGGLISYVVIMLPDVGDPQNISIELTEDRLKRGKYLAHSVAVCMDCHSTRDWNRFSGPPVEGTIGQGGEVFDQTIGFPGAYYAKNITPSGIGDWSDGELLRAIASGVDRDGKALFPIMPHPNYGKMDREDLFSIIAYLRSLKSIDNEVPESVSDFPMSIIINTIPRKAEISYMPNPKNKEAYGSYLFTAASCADCHTKTEKGQPIPGMELAGGFEFPLYTGGVVRSSNITPDMETGIGKWTEDQFVQKFKYYTDSTYSPPRVQRGEFNTVMPWVMYASMKEDDLKAIYAFLMTQKPVSNKVEHFTP